MATAPTATDKKSALQKQIEDLQKKMQELDQEAVQEIKLKLHDARKVVSTLEDELTQLTGKPAGEPRAKRIRRPSITDEHLQPQALAVMAKHGKEGLNARQIAEHLHQDAIRVRKFIADNPKLLKKTGKGAGTKFFFAVASLTSGVFTLWDCWKDHPRLALEPFALLRVKKLDRSM